MILDQIAWVDCIVFLIFLVPQLLIDVRLFELILCGIKVLPFLFFILPFQLVHERYFTKTQQKTPFAREATLFQDVVIRCVRYAFAKIPASIGKVFFSKRVALPFMRFRMLRHGILNRPVYWKEVNRDEFKAIYIVDDSTQRPDVVIYYCHGGGFSMGSSYFYMEFLIAWMHILKEAGYSNPAVVALEYTLVPQATYPTQVQQALAGYKYVLSLVESPSQVCVSGDSAGATLILSLLLCLSNYSSLREKMPALAIPISPWVTIISPKNKNTPSDYLNAESLHLYGSQYIGSKALATDSMVSPGCCKDLSWWRRASPLNGWYFLYGSEEVFAPETKELISTLKKAGAPVDQHEEERWIHAWPVVKLFLCNRQQERQHGLRLMVEAMKRKMPPKKLN